MSIPSKAIRDGFVATVNDGGLGLGWGDPVFPGPRPEGFGNPCTTLIIYDGTGRIVAERCPVEKLYLQVSCYASSEETAETRAWDAYRALAGTFEWVLTGWTVMLARCRPPRTMPKTPGQGGRLAWVVLNVELTMRETA